MLCMGGKPSNISFDMISSYSPNISFTLHNFSYFMPSALTTCACLSMSTKLTPWLPSRVDILSLVALSSYSSPLQMFLFYTFCTYNMCMLKYEHKTYLASFKNLFLATSSTFKLFFTSTPLFFKGFTIYLLASFHKV